MSHIISTQKKASSRNSLALASVLALGACLPALHAAQANGQPQAQPISALSQQDQMQVIASYGDCLKRNPALWNATYDDLVRSCTPAPVAQPAYAPPPVQRAYYAAPQPRWASPGFSGGRGTGPININVVATGGIGQGGGVIIPTPSPKPGPVITHPCQVPPCPTSPAQTKGNNGLPPGVVMTSAGPRGTGLLVNPNRLPPGMVMTSQGPRTAAQAMSMIKEAGNRLNQLQPQKHTTPFAANGPAALQRPVTIPQRPLAQTANLQRPFIPQTMNRPATSFQRPVTNFQRPVTFNRPMTLQRPVLSRPVAPMRVANAGGQRRR